MKAHVNYTFKCADDELVNISIDVQEDEVDRFLKDLTKHCTLVRFQVDYQPKVVI